jgi:methyltransferase (TIGR00027 family)
LIKPKKGIRQYVSLGAGLDTFAQCRPEIASKLHIFEIDQPDTLAWKQRRLIELGYGFPEYLHSVPVDFVNYSWREQLLKAGFDTAEPAVVACTGVSLYLTKKEITSTLDQLATLASGSKFAMTFYLPMELLDEEDKPLQEMGAKGARAAGTPFVSFFSPNEIMTLAREAGLKKRKRYRQKIWNKIILQTEQTTFHLQAEVFLLATT